MFSHCLVNWLIRNESIYISLWEEKKMWWRGGWWLEKLVQENGCLVILHELEVMQTKL